MVKQINVACSGSGFKFPALVGSLKAVVEAGYIIRGKAGTSGGSIVSAMLACGMSVNDMEVLTLSRDWSGMLRFNLFAPVLMMGYCNGKNLLAFMHEMTGGKTFADLEDDLHIIASDISFMKPFVFSKETTPDVPVAFAARCSASIPFAYGMMQYEDAEGLHYLMDGGMQNNIPADYLAMVPKVPRLGIRLVAKEKPLTPGWHWAHEIAPRVVNSILDANENAHVDLDERDGIDFAFVETGYANGLDANMSVDLRQRLLNDGHDLTAAALQKAGL